MAIMLFTDPLLHKTYYMTKTKKKEKQKNNNNQEAIKRKEKLPFVVLLRLFLENILGIKGLFTFCLADLVAD
jgi:hypothetical protein